MDEQWRKEAPNYYISKQQRCVLVNGPIIVGGGPSGLATASCLRQLHGVPCVILEKQDCIASLWKHRTYDRLKLHLPKHFCELPLMPFPPEFPTYLTKYHFIQYLESYAKKFELSPRFNECVQSASYDKTSGLWKILTVKYSHYSNLPVSQEDLTEYICRWLIVATGENEEPLVPDIKGIENFNGPIIHTSAYKSGKNFQGKNVLVVGCANSGMEISLDLSDHDAKTAMAVRSTTHILPREMFGRSTFGVAMWLMKWLPVRIVDGILLFVTWLMLGNTSKYGLKRPSIGPLELKKKRGKTPVLDAGALARIKSGKIKILPGVDRLTSQGAKFLNGEHLDFDSVILATGYKSSVLSWLQECSFFSEDGTPKEWKGQNGLYAVGFAGRGLLGACADAMNVAADVGRQWKEETRRLLYYKRE